jgi:hypothetical protein
MKSFKEYLAESKKVYSFKVKVAGELPEKFTDNLKARMDKYSVATFEQVTKTPVQKLPIDFPELENAEVTVFEVVTEYPVTGPLIEKELKEMGLDYKSYRVRGSQEPSEVDQAMTVEDDDTEKEALLTDSEYKEAEGVEAKNYFGDDFNASFLQDLQKAREEAMKEAGCDPKDPKEQK